MLCFGAAENSARARILANPLTHTWRMNESTSVTAVPVPPPPPPPRRKTCAGLKQGPPRVLAPEAIDAFLDEVMLLGDLSEKEGVLAEDAVMLLRAAHERLKDITDMAQESILGKRAVFINSSGQVVRKAEVELPKAKRAKP
jgi:hypothetical protein